MRARLVLPLFAAAAAMSFDAEAAKKNPVHKVLELLQGMQKQLEKEGQEDETAFNKQNCWCETNIKEKTASVQGVATKTKELQSKVKELTAASGRLLPRFVRLQKQGIASWQFQFPLMFELGCLSAAVCSWLDLRPLFSRGVQQQRIGATQVWTLRSRAWLLRWRRTGSP